MDGTLFDAEAATCDGCGQALADLLAVVPLAPLLALALVLLLYVAGCDAHHPHRGVRR